MHIVKRILAFLRKYWRWLILALLISGITYLEIISTEARHITIRGLLHFISSTFLTLGMFFLLRWRIKKNAWLVNYVAPDKQRLLTIAGLLIASLLPLREPWDVFAQNNSVIKSYFDILSWYLGPTVSIWGLSRFDRLED